MENDPLGIMLQWRVGGKSYIKIDYRLIDLWRHYFMRAEYSINGDLQKKCQGGSLST